MNKNTFNILLVDDEEGLLIGLKKILELRGFYVLTALTGKKAVEILKKNEIDLAFIDLKLGDTDGIEVVRAVQPTTTPIVIMTAFASVETAVRSMKIGVTDYIQKPFNNDDILSIADRFFQKKDHQHQTIKMDSKKLGRLVFKSKKVLEVFDTVEKIKDCDIPILLLGESGTGKEVFARLIHELGKRKRQPFVGINCSAIPGELLESELFGHEKGSFSGALTLKPGKFEIAEDGTLFLDEIGDMEYKLQSKLLRVLEEKSFEHIGGITPIEFKARVIASTNRDLKQMVIDKEFRSDLYFRLRGLEILLPPLRERREDLDTLIHHFMQLYTENHNKNVSISSEAIRFIKNYSWPGNIRELKNVIESAVLLAEDDSLLLPKHFNIEDENANDEEKRIINELEKKYILKTLEKNQFNRTLAAQDLKISRKTLYNKIKKYTT